MLRRAAVRGGRRTFVTKPSLYGQPIAASHPHLVKEGELTPGFTASEYENRRKKLMDSLPDGSIVLAVAAPIKYMSASERVVSLVLSLCESGYKLISYSYRQASDFWYLTGFAEPNSAVVLEKTRAGRGYKMSLFSTGFDQHKALWDGASTPIEQVAQLFGADEAYTVREFPSVVASVIHGRAFQLRNPPVYVDLPSSAPKLKQFFQSALSRLGNREAMFLPHLSCSVKTELLNANQGVSLWDLYQSTGLTTSRCKALAPEVAKLRSVKSEAEQRVMKAAADISSKAHSKTMRFVEPGMSESLVAAHYEYLCRRDGAQRLAYVPVVASGGNGLVIHYTTNNHIIEKGEMVLIDAGCEYNGYASDITRTFPASGTFTPPQRDLYTAVLRVQRDLIKLCTASAKLTIWDIHHKSYRMMREELKQLGIDVSSDSVMNKVYPHGVGHMIGIDLHETDSKNTSLLAGNVVTIEPGVYIPPSPDFPPHFHNMAVQIEDMVLVGEEHPVVLSANAPKEIVDVEAAFQGTLGLEAF